MPYKREAWGSRDIWYPEKVAYPSTLEDLRQEIAKARKDKLKIRAAGSLHSLNRLCSTSGVLIHTDKLDKVLHIDKAHMTVKVQGGIKIKKLLQLLAEEGMTLPNQGYIADQSIAGAIATATHGSGKTGTLSSFVEEIEIVDANGVLHNLSPQINEHLFAAAVVNLGCLGIVYTVTLKCISLQRVHLVKERRHLAMTLRQQPDLLKNNDYFQFMIDPYSDELVTWCYKFTQEKVKNRLGYKFHRLLIKLLAVMNMDIFYTPYALWPYLLKFFIAMSSSKSFIDYSYKLLSPADEGHYVEEEIAIPIQHFENALADTRRIIDQFGAKKIRRVVVILIRYADADSIGYLSPALGRQTVYISLITIAKDGYQDIFREIETALYKYEGRPHWGKVHFLTKDRIQQLYGSNLTHFIEARRELDPEGLFFNDYLEKLLG